ncbi:hypothetical protein [Lacticaseibacillus brantae]|uniref:Uncharacterized protein n=1 Tax=Lacticaseibacillus brantae DSM 23927 TaxID=1423727 RepID=A0A0R2B7T3_9LACO|nr:hypothetical protein [Lacticaseibacillus brantae]KRM72166.1 hypothetical protein FC34_GL001150 [Lacticaseibacillus brantae DSM 23927]
MKKLWIFQISVFLGALVLGVGSKYLSNLLIFPSVLLGLIADGLLIYIFIKYVKEALK